MYGLLVLAILIAAAGAAAAFTWREIDRRRSKTEVAALLERFAEGSAEKWEWDDFLNIPFADPELEGVRNQFADLPSRFPPQREGQYCSPEGSVAILQLAAELRSRESSA
jgi:hypothetical protein